jgi:ribosome-binding protein aMBF1 (putative translation factor)
MSMKTETNHDKLKRILSSEQSSWHGEATWREQNGAWLTHSFGIAVRILTTLRSKSMTQKELADKMGVSAQHVNKIVKGQENLSLETIAKLESALGIELISLPPVLSATEVSYNLRQLSK